ncbi:MAG: hypothetical protein IJX78_03625 [Bacilli bacterium]|nr:hypothetical protein [Bacilli bacterium]
MKLKKYFLLAVVMLFGIFALTACGGGEETPDNPDGGSGTQVTDKCKDGHTFKDGKCTVCDAKDPNYQGGDSGINPTDVNCALDRENELCLDPETWNWEYNKDDWDGKGMEIEIMVLPVSEYDPNDANYSGERKTEKRQLIAKIESEYNIDIVYKDYPAEAPWGPERVKWIFTGVLNGTDVGDIFLIDSSWVPTLARNSAIAELYNTKRETGIFTDYNYEQSNNYNLMGQYNSKVYAYASGEARPDHWLHYNQDLIDQYNLPDPATLWNNNEWTWSAFKDLLAQAQALFDAEKEKGEKWAFGGDYFDVAKGLVAARGGAFIKNGRVLLTSQTVIDVFSDLQEIENLYWEPNGSTVSTTNFKDGLVLFQTGGMWFYGNAERWPATLDFSISAVPYPRNDDDVNLDTYQIPIGYEGMYAIRSVENGENGLSSAILFNIFDDLTNGLKPESKSTALSPDEKYQAYLEARIDSAESVAAIMDVQTTEGLTYFEMIGVVSMSLGDGSHYGEYGIYPQSSSLIVNSKGDKTPSVVLSSLQDIYQKELDALLAG